VRSAKIGKGLYYKPNEKGGGGEEETKRDLR